MRIWLINHYGVPPKYYPLARPTLFAKYLGKMGHKVTIFAASAVHNSDLNLIEDNSLYRKDTVDGVHYVYVCCRQYKGNGKERVINLSEFAERLPKVCRRFKKPDAIVATSFDPLTCYTGIRLAKKYKAKAIAEIADLWPETPVAYGMMKPNSPVVKLLRILEKRIYKEADAIIFTMEGGYDYIVEQGWEKDIPRRKVFYISNGVDLDKYDLEKIEYTLHDDDLENDDYFRIVYTGALRKTNNAQGILDVAKNISDPSVRFLIWGDGEEVDVMKKRIESEGITNVILKGRVEKKYIPFILSKANLCLMHTKTSKISKYGMSLNKSFDYLAAGKPIISTNDGKYDYIEQNGAGICVDSNNVEKYAEAIQKIRNMDINNYQKMCNKSRETAKRYDFRNITKNLVRVVES